MSSPSLFVFAKAPVAGEVKTRLQPTYTAEQSAAIASVMIRETLALAVASWCGRVYLATSPDTAHPLFAELASRYSVRVRAQCGTDLGMRMHEAIDYGVTQYGAAAVMGCDVPHCPGEILRDASKRLARGRAVLGPSDDGGYYLIGLSCPCVELFTDIAWGSEEVRATTVARARALGTVFDMLAPLRDIDTPDDLHLVAQTFPPLKRVAL